MDFEKLLAEHEFAEITKQVENLVVFEFVRFDKVNRIELRISSHRCDNGLWQDDYLVCINGSKKYGDYHGFGFPYQHAEFLKLTYDDIAKMYACYGYEKAEIKQLSLFTFMQEKGIL